MQRHADEGARIIDRLGFLNDAVPAIRYHHERFDGTGYTQFCPRCVAGLERILPLEGLDDEGRRPRVLVAS